MLTELLKMEKGSYFKSILTFFKLLFKTLVCHKAFGIVSSLKNEAAFDCHEITANRVCQRGREKARDDGKTRFTGCP